MLGGRNRWQEEAGVLVRLLDLIPEDHILRRVDKVLKLGWLRSEVRSCYSADKGRPSIDPESALRLMLAGFFEGIVHDRKLMRTAQVNIAIRWFIGYGLTEKLPHHSSLTRIRQRWGAERFQRIFQRVVADCVAAGLVDGETVHTDATLIRADVSWSSLTTEYVEKVLEANREEDSGDDESGEAPKRAGRPKRARRPKKRSVTDPDASMVTSRKDQRMEPCFKQHTTVDDKAGVIVDVELTTGEENEGGKLLETLDRVEELTDTKVLAVTGDAAYAHPRNYAALEKRGIDAVIPPPREQRRKGVIPIRRFKYDAKRNVVRCPGGKLLSCSYRAERGWIYRARARDCRGCSLRARCFSARASSRTILIVDGYESLLRARRGWDEKKSRDYNRHRWRVEGVHGEAKTQHGLRRAVRRGLANVAIQVYLTATVMNLKRLAASLLPPLRSMWRYLLLKNCYDTIIGLKCTIRQNTRIILPAQNV